MGTFIRLVFTTLLLYGVYTETGIWTVILTSLICLNLEARNYLDKQKKFENRIVEAIMFLTPNADGFAIAKYIEVKYGGRVSIGSLYTTLARMKENGLVESWDVFELTPERGGLPNRYFKLREANND